MSCHSSRHFVLAALAATLVLPSQAADGWRVLFNGRDLTGWKSNVYPDSWSVVDGALRARATRESSHLFFVGERAEGFERFKDFELEVVARSEPNSNGGIFIHTDHTTHSPARRLSKGSEIQLNSSEREKRKTGSLYAVVDLPTSPVDETKWFTTLITVRGKRITVQLDADGRGPHGARPRGARARAGRKLDPAGGAIACKRTTRTARSISRACACVRWRRPCRVRRTWRRGLRHRRISRCIILRRPGPASWRTRSLTGFGFRRG